MGVVRVRGGESGGSESQGGGIVKVRGLRGGILRVRGGESGGSESEWW